MSGLGRDCCPSPLAPAERPVVLPTACAAESRRRELLFSAGSMASSGSRPGTGATGRRATSSRMSCPALLALGDVRAQSRGSLPLASNTRGRLSVVVPMHVVAQPVPQPWNELLRDSATRRDPNVLQDFWRDVKSHILFRFTSLPFAWQEIDPEESGVISFPKFSHFLHIIGLDLDQRAARGLFSDMTKGGVHLNLKEFESTLMKGTVKKLQNAMRGFYTNRQAVQDHVQRFVEYLHHIDETRQTMAIDRFQRKLSVQFCSNLFQMFTEHILSNIEDATVDRSKSCIERSTFCRCLRTLVGQQKLFAFEASYLQCIFDRVDMLKDKRLPVCDLVTALVLLSPDHDRKRKLTLMFQVFDTDCDGCLLYDQVMDMILCVSMQNSIAAGMFSVKQGGLVFQEELSFQEGQRTYECVRWHLEHVLGIKDVVNFPEVWQTLEALPGALYTLIPSTYKLYWLSSIVEADRMKAAPPTGARFHRTDFAQAVTDRFKQALHGAGNHRLQDLSVVLQNHNPNDSEHKLKRLDCKWKSDGKGAQRRKFLLRRTDRDELPSYKRADVEAARWGPEAGSRYRLFEQAQMSWRKTNPKHCNRLCSCDGQDCKICSADHIVVG